MLNTGSGSRRPRWTGGTRPCPGGTRSCCLPQPRCTTAPDSLLLLVLAGSLEASVQLVDVDLVQALLLRDCGKARARGQGGWGHWEFGGGGTQQRSGGQDGRCKPSAAGDRPGFPGNHRLCVLATQQRRRALAPTRRATKLRSRDSTSPRLRLLLCGVGPPQSEHLVLGCCYYYHG